MAADGGQERTCSLKLKRAKCCFFSLESQKISVRTLPETEPKTSRAWAGVRAKPGSFEPDESECEGGAEGGHVFVITPHYVQFLFIV